jgi:hypothetical protein
MSDHRTCSATSLPDPIDGLAGGCPKCYGRLHQSSGFGMAACLYCGWVELDGYDLEPMPLSARDFGLVSVLLWKQCQAHRITWEECCELIDGFRISMEA